MSSGTAKTSRKASRPSPKSARLSSRASETKPAIPRLDAYAPPRNDGVEGLRKQAVIHAPVRHHVAIARVGRLRSRLLIFRLHQGKPVAADVEHRALGLDVVKPRIVAAEDRGLHGPVGCAQRRVAEFLLHGFGDFEAPQTFDLPLRCPGP